MLSFSADLSYLAFSIRRVNKATDRPVVREIFRREFYGNYRPVYADNCLWEIYDRMDTDGALGAYLVSRGSQVLFLLEIHPSIQMDLNIGQVNDPGTIGIYCFFYSRDETICLPAFRACVSVLLEASGIHQILTSLSGAMGYDSRARLLEKSGFRRLHDASKTLIFFECTRETFGVKKHPATDILFATASSFSD